MILQISFTLIYRIILETSGASNFRIVELHWRDFAVFVFLSSRTNTRQGLALVRCIPPLRRCARASSLSFFQAGAVGGFCCAGYDTPLINVRGGRQRLPRP